MMKRHAGQKCGGEKGDVWMITKKTTGEKTEKKVEEMKERK